MKGNEIGCGSSAKVSEQHHDPMLHPHRMTTQTQRASLQDLWLVQQLSAVEDHEQSLAIYQSCKFSFCDRFSTTQSCFDVVSVPVRSEMCSLIVKVGERYTKTDIACPKAWCRM